MNIFSRIFGPSSPPDAPPPYDGKGLTLSYDPLNRPAEHEPLTTDVRLPRVPWPPETVEYYAIVDVSGGYRQRVPISSFQELDAKDVSHMNDLLRQRVEWAFQTVPDGGEITSDHPSELPQTLPPRPWNEADRDTLQRLISHDPFGESRYLPASIAQQRVPDELVPDSGWFTDKLHKRVSHRTYVKLSYGENENGNGKFSGLELVSSRYRAALEAVEPDLHNFYPYTIRCRDGREITGHSLFHLRQHANVVNKEASGYILTQGVGHVYWASIYTGLANGDSKGGSDKLVIDPVLMAGRHYVRIASTREIIVTAELAEKLRPLLDKKTYLLPCATLPADWTGLGVGGDR